MKSVPHSQLETRAAPSRLKFTVLCTPLLAIMFGCGDGSEVVVTGTVTYQSLPREKGPNSLPA